MGSISLLFVCVSAFIAVFILLAVLAMIMRLIMLLFPDQKIHTEAAVIAAIAATISAHYPQTVIKNIEELK